MSVRSAYKAGRAGRPAPDTATPDELDAYRDGLADRANEPDEQRGEQTPPRQAPAARRTTSRSSGSGAGIILGLVVWALVSAYLKEGPAGPRRWLKAKFTNQVESPEAAAVDRMGAAAQMRYARNQ